jgi:alcohol dehydrogenase class IV
VSNAANPLTDALARDGILRASRSLRAAVADGTNLQAREDLSIACVFGGIVSLL